MTSRSKSRKHQLEESQLGRSVGHPGVGVHGVDGSILEFRLDEVGMLTGPAKRDEKERDRQSRVTSTERSKEEESGEKTHFLSCIMRLLSDPS